MLRYIEVFLLCWQTATLSRDLFFKNSRTGSSVISHTSGVIQISIQAAAGVHIFNFEDFPLICVAVNVTRATVCIVSPLSHFIPKFTSLLCECTLHKIPVFKKQFTVLYFLLYHNQVKVTLNWRNGKLCFKAVCISPVSGLVHLYICSNKAFFILLIGYPFALPRLLFHDYVIKTCFKSSLNFFFLLNTAEGMCEHWRTALGKKKSHRILSQWGWEWWWERVRKQGLGTRRC